MAIPVDIRNPAPAEATPSRESAAFEIDVAIIEKVLLQEIIENHEVASRNTSSRTNGDGQRFSFLREVDSDSLSASVSFALHAFFIKHGEVVIAESTKPAVAAEHNETDGAKLIFLAGPDKDSGEPSSELDSESKAASHGLFKRFKLKIEKANEEKAGTEIRVSFHGEQLDKAYYAARDYLEMGCEINDTPDPKDIPAEKWPEAWGMQKSNVIAGHACLQAIKRTLLTRTRAGLRRTINPKEMARRAKLRTEIDHKLRGLPQGGL